MKDGKHFAEASTLQFDYGCIRTLCIVSTGTENAQVQVQVLLN